MTLRIAILGSGPAGLTTALALEKSTGSAVNITLLDRNKSATDYKGIEYGIRDRACKALERLGLKDLALVDAHAPLEQVFQNASSGELERRVSIEPGTTFNVLRTEFLERMTALLSRTEILRQHNAIRLEVLTGGSVRIHFDKREDGTVNEALDFDMVIAADGANSVVRGQYFPHAKTIDRGFSSIYMLIQANDEDASVPPHFRDLSDGHVNFYSHGKFSTNIIFPEGRGRMSLALNFDHATASRIWRDHGLTPDVKWPDIPIDTKKSIARTIARDTPAYDGLMANALELGEDWNGPFIYQWAMRDSDTLVEPYAPDANIVFVGDSVRAFIPTIGMGASLAIEDAEWLGTRLGKHLSSQDGRENSIQDIRQAVFLPYVEARQSTWADMLDRARMAARNFIDHESM
ncbi:MAG: FAD-dependent monooxygenase, partial [Polaromonas sp.]|nr:FAD-dependent monooxygenase [Polaromonas sp.]